MENDGVILTQKSDEPTTTSNGNPSNLNNLKENEQNNQIIATQQSSPESHSLQKILFEAATNNIILSNKL